MKGCSKDSIFASACLLSGSSDPDTECLYDLETTDNKMLQIPIKQCEADPDMLCKVRSEIFSCNSTEYMF